MNKHMKIAAMLAGISIGSTICTLPAANAAVIDFNSAATGSFLTADYFEDGVLMDLLTGHYDIFSGITPGATNFLNIDFDTTSATASTVRFTFVSGVLFDLLSLDFIVDIGGGTLTTSEGGLVDFSILSIGPQIFAGPLFTNLAFVDFSTTGPGIGIDTINLVPSPVSEPGSIGLLGLALAGIAWGRRRYGKR